MPQTWSFSAVWGDQQQSGDTHWRVIPEILWDNVRQLCTRHKEGRHMRFCLIILPFALCLHAGDTFVPAVTNEAVGGAAQRVGLKIRNLETRPVQLRFTVLRTD